MSDVVLFFWFGGFQYLHLGVQTPFNKPQKEGHLGKMMKNKKKMDHFDDQHVNE